MRKTLIKLSIFIFIIITMLCSIFCAKSIKNIKIVDKKDYYFTLEKKEKTYYVSEQEIIDYIDNNFYICPECGSPAYLSSSMGEATSAEICCYNCDWEGCHTWLDYRDREEAEKQTKNKYKEIYGSSAARLADMILKDSTLTEDSMNEHELARGEDKNNDTINY